MDVWVNFKHATKWQAEGIFKCFFPAKHAPAPAAPHDPAHASEGKKGKDKGTGAGPEGASSEKMAESKRERATRTHAIPLLSEEEISDLARRFADAIPENELSVRAPSFRFHVRRSLTPTLRAVMCSFSFSPGHLLNTR